MSELIKICEFCHREYIARRERQRFCSKDCQYAATKTHVDCICEVCGAQFISTPSRIASGKGRFCSKECYSIWQREVTARGEKSRLWKGGKITLTCQECGKRFSVDPCRAELRKFCSEECRLGHYRKSSEMHCEVCGNVFYAKPAHKRKYCSRKCMAIAFSGEGSYLWSGGKVTATCEYCNNQFRTYQQYIDKGGARFCSKSCANRANAKSGDEHPCWKGGVSFEPYPIIFNAAFRRSIRERDNYSCAICRLPGHDVHHIDYDKAHTNGNNCITLCHTCHPTTNHRRDYWQHVLSKLLTARLTGANL